MFEEEEVQRLRDQLSAARHNYDQARRDLEAEQRARQQLVDERDSLREQLASERARAEKAETERDEAVEERDENERRLLAAKERREAAESALATARREAQEAREALRDAREALNRDRTGLAAALNKIREELRGRYWMRHEKDGGEAGSWGCYPYPEHTVRTLRQEVSWAFEAIGKIAHDALRASGNLADESVAAADRALASPVAPREERALARNQPCGCVVCTCENEDEPDRCLGCGAKHCGTHPVGAIPSPVYVSAPREERGDGGKNGGAR
jgi:hypothetical protein